MMNNTTYTVWIKTGDQPLGGTDSNVFIMLYGANGHTDWLFLPTEDVFAFEEGSTDKFVLDVPDVGRLTKCCVGEDGSEDSGWYVENVRVRHDSSGQEWLFVFNQWLGQEEAGRQAVCVSL